jgi:hypothetical protein
MQGRRGGAVGPGKLGIFCRALTTNPERPRRHRSPTPAAAGLLANGLVLARQLVRFSVPGLRARTRLVAASSKSDRPSVASSDFIVPCTFFKFEGQAFSAVSACVCYGVASCIGRVHLSCISSPGFRCMRTEGDWEMIAVFDGCLRILDAFEFAQNSLSSEHRVWVGTRGA